MENLLTNEVHFAEDDINSSMMLSLSDIQSFNELDLLKSDYLDNVNHQQATINACPYDLFFTSAITNRNFNTIRNQFKLLFKINYPNVFFEKIFNREYFTVFAIDRSTKELAGFCVINIKNNDKKAEILAIGVIKEFQNKRVGSRLLQKCIQELINYGIYEVSLVAQSINLSAVKLYKNFGFVIEAERKDYYNFGNDLENKAYFMKKTLIRTNSWLLSLLSRFTCVLFEEKQSNIH